MKGRPSFAVFIHLTKPAGSIANICSMASVADDPAVLQHRGSPAEVSRHAGNTRKDLRISPQEPRYSKSGIQLQEHPDGMRRAQPLLSFRMMNAPGIVESKKTSTLVWNEGD